MEVQMTGGNQDQLNVGTDCHVIKVGSQWSSSMELRFKQRPILLKPSASNYSSCIFKVSQSLAQINEKAYKPRIVSIGPYHHGQERLNMVEQHKPRFFSALLERTKHGGAGLDDYFNAVASMENEIRNCYSEELLCGSSALVEMMVLDACFIVEVFRFFRGVTEPDPDDPFFGMMWILTFLLRDLLQIENQIPFFVLQVVFHLSKGDKAATDSLEELALEFFKKGAIRPREQFKEFKKGRDGVSDVKHLLDLLRLRFIGHAYPEEHGVVDAAYLQLIPSATRLLCSGIKFKPRKDDNSDLLNIQFKNAKLQIPTLTLDDTISSFLLNCVAYEQCSSYCSKHITSYVTFMRCLVSTEMDAEFLSEKGLLVNYLGSNAEVATFFNDLNKDIAFDIETSYLAEIFEQVNKHHQSKWHVRWAGIKREYFGSPWSFISAVAAFVLLVLTVLQAFYAVFAYYRPPK